MARRLLAVVKNDTFGYADMKSVASTESLIPIKQLCKWKW